MALAGYFTHLGVLLGLYALLAISFNLAVGYTGLINLGHVAFFGVGAYTTALLTLQGIPLYLSIPLAAVVATIFGMLLALPTVRLKGDYLALATLGFTFIMGSVARNWVSLTRGALGLPGLPRLAPAPFMTLLIIGLVAILVFVLVKRLALTQFGRTLQAIRDDELAAQVLGKNTFMHKVAAMALSACIAGIAGAFFAHYITFIDPSVFSVPDLILLLSIIVVGGLGSVKGTLVGTFIIILLPEPLRFIGLPPTLVGPVREMLFAAILLLILVYRPKGIFGKVDLA